MTERLDLLELLHPDGNVAHVAVLGRACPADLAAATGARAGRADLVVLAPSAAELRERGWLDRALRSLGELPARDGVVYAVVPPAARGGVRRGLTRAGFVLAGDMLHLPSWSDTRQIVPLRPAVARRAVRSYTSGLSWRRRAAASLLALPGATHLLGRTSGSVAVVARRPGGRPLFEWLFRAANVPADGATAAVRIKWRAGKGSVVVQAVGPSGQPLAVAKATLTAGAPDGRAEREIAALDRLGSAARSAGVAVPEGRLERIGGWPVVLSSLVPGDPAADLLAAGRVPLQALLGDLAAWLETWSRATVTRHAVGRAWLERAITAPARLLSPEIEGGARYAEWLEERCREMDGALVPLVASHNDLTMSNLLLTPRRELGVVDWEAAQSDGLPLRDYWYAAVDAAAAAERYADRAAAFTRCFGGDGSLRRLVVAHEGRLARAVDVPDRFAALCFHACWLQHAVDERRKRAAGEPRPFRAIVQAIASEPQRFGRGPGLGVGAGAGATA
jgi:hypothetical protein